jgi:DNA-binding response OmpR family regulator
MARVLIVEDDFDLLRQLATRFAAAGHEVDTAVDGEWALGKLASARFDLMVTDIVMPVRDGGEVIVLAKKQFPRLKVIAISGGYRAKAGDFLAMAGELGADAILGKPFQHGDLLETARRLLDGGLATPMAAAS